MGSEEHMIYFLLGLLQVIGIGLTSWALLTLVKVLERISLMEGTLTHFPTAQVANNRHRIENLERAADNLTMRVENTEKTLDEIKSACNMRHDKRG